MDSCFRRNDSEMAVCWTIAFSSSCHSRAGGNPEDRFLLEFILSLPMGRNDTE